MKTQIQKLAALSIFALLIQTGISQTSKEKVSLVSNGNALNAYFYRGNAAQSCPTVILLHGVPGNDDNPLNLAENLNSKGFNILVFNYQGTYSSEGYFSNFNCMDDLDAAISWLKQPQNMINYGIDSNKIVVCGYSFGGCVALSRALKNTTIRNIISVSGLDQSVSLKAIAADSTHQAMFENRISGMFAPAGPFRSDPEKTLHELVDYMILHTDDFDLVKYAERLKDRNILFITGWLDVTTPMEENLLPLYRRLMSLGAQNVSIQAFNTAHRYNEVRPQLADAIAGWVQSTCTGAL